MMSWIDYVLTAFETFGFVYFFDSFFDIKKHKYRWLTYPIIFFGMNGIILILLMIFPNYGHIIKVFLLIIMLSVVCICFYQTTYIVAFFFSAINYFLLFFVDCSYVSIFGMEETSVSRIIWIGLRLAWLALLFVLRKKLPNIKEYIKKNRVAWMHFAWAPVLSGFVGIYFYYLFLSQIETPVFYSFLSVGILVLNIVSLFLMQDSLLKEEQIQQTKIQLQNKHNQLKVFYDMQSLYERQGRKLHDYKKQLVTIQKLIESGNSNAASKLVNDLTGSVDIEMSEVNIGHPVVNAVLNQGYHIAKGKGIGMIFSIFETDRIKLSDEDIVIVFGNLLDNAICECERIVSSQKDAVIHVKLAEMDQEIIFTVQNPVINKVQINDDNEVQGPFDDGHGIGLINVRETVEKYNGSFVVYCDESEFVATVVI